MFNKDQMKLQKLGGDYQLVIDSSADLGRISDLAEAHWMATSAPSESFTCDPAFLAYLDSDRNGRIRSSEVIDAQRWMFRMLCNRSRVKGGVDTLLLDCIDTSHDDGGLLRSAAERILINIGKSETSEITLDDVRNRQRIVSSGTCNGDGIIPPDSVDDQAVSVLIQDVIRTVGGATDAGGEPGVGTSQLDAFLQEAEEFVAWKQQGKIPEPSEHTEIMTLGDSTPDAFEVLDKIRAKVDEYFDLCWLEAIKDGAPATNPAADSTTSANNIAEKPLARPVADEILTIDDQINPEFRSELHTFRDRILARFKETGDRCVMSRSEWEKAKARFIAYESWLEQKRGGCVEKIPTSTLVQYLDGTLAERLRDLIRADHAVSNELTNVGLVEQLILYQKWLMEFTNNFVSFACLFDPAKPSLIQIGSLVIDGRRFDLTMKVINRQKHKAIVEQSNICVMYLKVNRMNADGPETMEVATAVTSGSMTRLFVGKAGMFFTPDGRQWDAEVIDFVANPVSLTEALKKPFAQLGLFLRSQAERFSANRYKELEQNLGSSIQTAEQALTVEHPKEKDTEKASPGNLRELMLSGSVAFAALGSAFAFITKTLQSVSFFDMISVVGALALIIFAPVLVVSMIKLRNRNLSVFLEACGWAINGQMRLSFDMGLLFTREPKPTGNVQYLRNDVIQRLLRTTDTETREQEK